MKPQFVKRQNVLCTARFKDADVDVETKDGHLEVTAAISGSERDRADEWVNQETLEKQWGPYRRNSIVMYQHSWVTPIGSIVDYARDGADSIARVRFAKGYEVPMPVGFAGVKLHMRDIRSMVEQRVVKSFSIAFDADKVEKDDDAAQVGRLDVTDWYETSLVTIPAYRNAQIRNGFAPDMDELVRMLAKYLGDERMKQYYMGTDLQWNTTTGSGGNIVTPNIWVAGQPEEVDEDPALLEAYRALDRALSSTPEAPVEFSEAELAQLRQLDMKL